MSDASPPSNTGSILGGLGGVLSVMGVVYTAVNHKRMRLNCCGRKVEMELDVDSTSVKVAPEPEKKEDTVQ